MVDAPSLYVGTSGFSYDAWRPSFYPDKLKKADMLSYYAERLGACELNNTFYRFPSEKAVAKWCAEVPDGFRFAIKAYRLMTWNRKLVDCAELCARQFELLAPLGDKLGCVYYQLPKYVERDVPLLEAFLEQQPAGARVAFEFAHESWHTEDVAELLRGREAALVASDDADAPAPKLLDGCSRVYLRLRRAEYRAAALRGWRQRICDSGAREAFVFFRHEDSGAGPELARRFLDV